MGRQRAFHAGNRHFPSARGRTPAKSAPGPDWAVSSKPPHPQRTPPPRRAFRKVLMKLRTARFPLPLRRPDSLRAGRPPRADRHVSGLGTPFASRRAFATFRVRPLGHREEGVAVSSKPPDQAMSPRRFVNPDALLRLPLPGGKVVVGPAVRILCVIKSRPRGRRVQSRRGRPAKPKVLLRLPPSAAGERNARSPDRSAKREREPRRSEFHQHLLGGSAPSHVGQRPFSRPQSCSLRRQSCRPPTPASRP